MPVSATPNSAPSSFAIARMATSAGRVAIVLALVGFGSLSVGCEPSAGPAGPMEIVVDTIGDTIRVHTVAGRVWETSKRLTEDVSVGELDAEDHYMLGEVSALAVADDGTIYVLDQQAKTVRAYGPDGVHRMSLGSEGNGPGELDGPDGGLAVLSDGRVLTRDPGNQRIQVFSSDGEPVDTWRLPTGLSTSEPLYVDSADNIWSSTVLDLSVPLSEWEHGFLRFSATGDSLPAQTLPVDEYEAAFIEARREGSWSRNRVPFSPSQEMKVTPYGEYVNAISESYSFDVLRLDGSVLRIGRDYRPVPVESGEATTARRRATRNFLRIDPEWSWNGPEIPAQKPPYRDLFVARDARYWVLLSEPGFETEDPAWEPDPGEPAAPRRWADPMAFDVFERDGTYLGRVEAPAQMQAYPAPVFRGDNVWAVTEDAFGIQRVARFTVTDMTGAPE